MQARMIKTIASKVAAKYYLEPLRHADFWQHRHDARGPAPIEGALHLEDYNLILKQFMHTLVHATFALLKSFHLATS